MDVAELKKLIEAINGAFEEFKAKNDTKIQALEAKIGTDPSVEAKIKDIQSASETSAKAMKDQIDTLEKAVALMQAPGGQYSIPDQPIYKGSKAAAFGQQAVDIFMAMDPSVHGHAKTDAISRLEQNTKRCLSRIEKAQGFVSRGFEAKSMGVFGAAGTGHTMDGSPSEGGFLLQSETSMDLMTNGFNNGEVTSRISKRTITGSDSLEIIDLDETSRADGSRGGGVRVYTDAELSEINDSMTKFSKIKIEPERLTGMYRISDKMLKNAAFLGQELNQLFREEFQFKIQDLIINGVGSGQALGILNSGYLVTVPKETGQSAATIVSENVIKMYSRFNPKSSGNSLVWIANRNVYPQLRTLTFDIGTGGEMSNMYIPPTVPGGTGSMEGYPVIFVEQAKTLGTVGDLMLCDLSQYIAADYGTIDEASSIHVGFVYGQTAFRFMYFFDGQPRKNIPITQKNGSDTLSPFVALATRS